MNVFHFIFVGSPNTPVQASRPWVCIGRIMNATPEIVRRAAKNNNQGSVPLFVKSDAAAARIYRNRTFSSDLFARIVKRFGYPPAKTARAILELRTGRDWGPIKIMPTGDRIAMSGLAKTLLKERLKK